MVDDENARVMLILPFFIFRSRLGCQIVVTKDMDGWEVTVPAGFADARS